MIQEVDETQVKELTRKELTQCQHCWKSRVEEGVTLFKCAGCKIMLYCSKECQKAEWPSHKATCKINQERREMMAARGQVDDFKTLRSFCAKHRPSMAHYAMRGLDLGVDPTRSKRDVIVINVRANHHATRPERAYKALTAEVVPATSPMFGFEGPEIRKQLLSLNTEQRCLGQIGGIMVLVHDVETGLSNACPTGFGEEVHKLKPGEPWQEPLLYDMNHGIVH